MLNTISAPRPPSCRIQCTIVRLGTAKHVDLVFPLAASAPRIEYKRKGTGWGSDHEDDCRHRKPGNVGSGTVAGFCPRSIQPNRFDYPGRGAPSSGPAGGSHLSGRRFARADHYTDVAKA